MWDTLGNRLRAFAIGVGSLKCLITLAQHISSSCCTNFFFLAAFMILENTPDEQHFKNIPFMAQNQRKFMLTIQKELALLHSSLPSGILVRSFEDRVVCMHESPQTVNFVIHVISIKFRASISFASFFRFPKIEKISTSPPHPEKK